MMAVCKELYRCVSKIEDVKNHSVPLMSGNGALNQIVSGQTRDNFSSISYYELFHFKMLHPCRRCEVEPANRVVCIAFTVIVPRRRLEL